MYAINVDSIAMSQAKYVVKSINISNAEYAREITTQWCVRRERHLYFLAEIAVEAKADHLVDTEGIHVLEDPEVTLPMQFQVRKQSILSL